MTRFGYALAAILLTALLGWVWFRPAQQEVSAIKPDGAAAAMYKVLDRASDRPPTLYCEFTNFADRSPLVGFYFEIDEARSPPRFALMFQREQDGTQEDFSGPDRPAWAFDATQSPSVIRAPDDETAINLYDYDPNKPGVNWFEAGLRSIRYRNLGGKCRRSAA